MTEGRIWIRFDGPPGPVAGRFIEVEQEGSGIKLGDWKQDGEDWLLILPDAFGQLERLMDVAGELIGIYDACPVEDKMHVPFSIARYYGALRRTYLKIKEERAHVPDQESSRPIG